MTETAEGASAPSQREDLLRLMGGLIAMLHVPRSLGSVMVPKEYDELRELIGDWGWSTAEEITERLRVILDEDR
jgi:hypothetical protein